MVLGTMPKTPRKVESTDVATARPSMLDDIIVSYRSKISELLALTEKLSERCASELSNAVLTPRDPSQSPRPPHPEVPPLAEHQTDVDSRDDSDASLISMFGEGDDSTKFEKGAETPTSDKYALGPPVQSISSLASQSTFKIRQEWEGDWDFLQIDLATKSIRNKMTTSSTDLAQLDAQAAMLAHSYSTIIAESGMCGRIVSSPSEHKRILWEVCGIILVLYDLLEIPLGIAFNVPKNPFQDAMAWLIRVYWTMNVPLSLTTGYISDGVLVMSVRSIFIRYCKTWLIVDVFTIIPDWLFFFLNVSDESMNESKDSGSLVRTLRFLRLWRIARLMRMSKLRDGWYMILDTLDSEKIGIIFSIFKNIMLLMVVTHYVACTWFAIGSAQGGSSWLKFHKFTNADANWERQFLASFHWSLTQVTPSSVDIYAQSESERLFAIGTVIFGMVGFSYLVGSITSSLARLQALRERRASNFWLLRKYLKKNKVPHELCVRIRGYVESQWERQEDNMSDTSVESLNLLSENLKCELRCAIDGPALSIHPLFHEVLVRLRGNIMRSILNAITHLHLAPQDILFTAGSDAIHMSFLTSGVMHYERIHQQSPHLEVVVANEDWIVEPVLWVSEWCHRGDLRSETSTELLQVKPSKLSAIARNNALAFAMFSTYAKEYALWLSRLPCLSDISKAGDAYQYLTEVVNRISRSLDLKPTSERKFSASVSLFAFFR